MLFKYNHGRGSRKGAYHSGFDWLRVAATVLVTYQHALAVSHAEEYAAVYGGSLGQYGVSIFMALSGYLAVHDDGSANDWIRRRLTKIYPPYWFVTILGFGLTALSGYKKISLSQFISQMLGTGYFTHGWNLVNVSSWFISLIVFCYFVSYTGKKINRETIVYIVVIVVSLLFVYLRIKKVFFQQVSSYMLAAVTFEVLKSRVSSLKTVVAVMLLSVAVVVPDTAYSVLSLCTVMFAAAWRKEGSIICLLSRHTYEYYLVHGVFLVGVSQYVRMGPIGNVSIAIGFSVITAWLLKRAISAAVARMDGDVRGSICP